MQRETDTVFDQIDTVRTLIHELDAMHCFDGEGERLASHLDHELAALAELLSDPEEEPEEPEEIPLFV